MLRSSRSFDFNASMNVPKSMCSFCSWATLRRPSPCRTEKTVWAWCSLGICNLKSWSRIDWSRYMNGWCSSPVGRSFWEKWFANSFRPLERPILYICWFGRESFYRIERIVRSESVVVPVYYNCFTLGFLFFVDLHDYSEVSEEIEARRKFKVRQFLIAASFVLP